MPECASLAKCPFFNDHLSQRPATAEMMKRTYCLGDHTRCARWMVASALGKQAVPADMFPCHGDRAQELLHPH